MNRDETLVTVAFVFFLLLGQIGPCPPMAMAQDDTASLPPLKQPFGYSDADKDGKNDLFRDAEGDGIDDVTARPYPHAFPYRDVDGDGKNDLFQDADGDGKNDTFGVIKQLKEYHVPFMDADDNGRNDVTGKQIPGYRLASPFRRAAGSIADEEEKERARARPAPTPAGSTQTATPSSSPATTPSGVQAGSVQGGQAGAAQQPASTSEAGSGK